MGIKGLAQYIASRDDILTTHALCDGFVVIDGGSLSHTLCKYQIDEKSIDNWNCAFGGDYDKYAHFVKEFIDELKKCKVTPLVVIDGGIEKKKMETHELRMMQRLERVAVYNPAHPSKNPPLPPNLSLVMQNVLKQEGVKVVQCVFEGDPCTAGIAKFLNCPVLGLDSDYYVFGVKYIPLDSLRNFPHVAAKIKGRYVIRCKQFEFKNLLGLFGGLQFSALPLVAVLLGNDYIMPQTFDAFLTIIGCLSEMVHKTGPKRWVKVHVLFRWLNDKNLEYAVGAILSTLPQNCRSNLLKKIELIVNGYLHLPYEMLVPLGFAQEYEKIKRSPEMIFRFEGNIENLELREFWTKDQIDTLMNFNHQFREEKTKTCETMEIFNMLKNNTDRATNNFFTSWPSWFADDYSIGNFPSMFVNMMFHRCWAPIVHMDDYSFPSSETMSLKIVWVIDVLLAAGRQESKNSLLYVTRKGWSYVHRYLDTPVDTGFPKRFPPLEKLRDTPMYTRRQIFDDTLEISGKETLLEDIPGKWRLYVATIVYWLQQTVKPIRNEHHMYAVLFTMLMGIIDTKIDHHRCFKSFYSAYYNKFGQIDAARQSEEADVSGIKDDSLMSALEAVTEKDCWLAAPYFISKHKMDEELRTHSGKFNVTIAHTFSQLQCCMRHAISLNALLGYPYEDPIIGELFSGTILYNLYSTFEIQPDVEVYIAETLQRSPSLLHLLKLLIAQVKRLTVFPDNSFDCCDKFGEYPEVSNEILGVMTLKGMTIFEEDFADRNCGRGVIKRKNKKKKKEESFDEDAPFEDVNFRQESTAIRRFRKLRTSAVTYDSTPSDDVF